MKISGYGSIKSTTRTQKKGSSSGTSFSNLLSGAQESNASAGSEASKIAATASLSNVLALQEISEEERRREDLVKRGKSMLESLETLRQQLLMGEISAPMLNQLSQQLSRQKQSVNDPRLMLVIDDIELRLAVELAKLEMSVASRSEL